MAPEQLLRKKIDWRTDMFAFGALLYEMAAGRRAFDGFCETAVVNAILEQHPCPVSSIQPLATDGFDYIVRTCLHKDPKKRWQTPIELLTALKWESSGQRERILRTVVAQLRGRPNIGASVRGGEDFSDVPANWAVRLRKGVRTNYHWIRSRRKIPVLILGAIMGAYVFFYALTIDSVVAIRSALGWYRPVTVGEVVYADENTIKEWRTGDLEILAKSGRAFRVVGKDRVRVEAKITHDGLERLQVRITEGPHHGRAGLIIP